MPPTVAIFRADSLELLSDGLQPPDGLEVPSTMKIAGRLRAEACVTDPPYGFDFSGDKDWDSFRMNSKVRTEADNSEAFAKFTERWAYGCRTNVLRPGAHLLAFTASRTIGPVDRGLQRAGFAIPRVMFWLYATGQVKNPNDLRPGCEPIFVGRNDKDSNGKILNDRGLNDMFKKDGLGQLHAQTWKEEDGKHPTDVLIDPTMVEGYEDIASLTEKYQGTFFVSKPSIKDRDYGCESLEAQTQFASKLASGQFKILCHSCGESRKLSFQTKKCPNCKSTDTELEALEALPPNRKNIHPTVKPIELMRRLVRLVSRPGHTIIDPFMGSGTTGIAAVLEGRNFIGIEREEEFFTIASARIKAAQEEFDATR